MLCWPSIDIGASRWTGQYLNLFQTDDIDTVEKDGTVNRYGAELKTDAK